MGKAVQLVVVLCFFLQIGLGAGTGGLGLRPGGTSSEKPANEEVQGIINSVKGEVEEQLGRPVAHFNLVSYKTQIVAGINYFAKVDIGEGNDNMLHIRVYKDLGQNVSLHSIQYPKAVNHPIEYF